MDIHIDPIDSGIAPELFGLILTTPEFKQLTTPPTYEIDRGGSLSLYTDDYDLHKEKILVIITYSADRPPLDPYESEFKFWIEYKAYYCA